MRKKPTINQTDIDAFHDAVAGTKPLAQEKVRLAVKTVKRRTKKTEFDCETITLREQVSPHSVDGEEFISYQQSGVSNKILRKLRKGQYNVEATLDLHGMSIDEAKLAVEHYLTQCLHRHKRVILIIHGKGHHSETPILKNKINQWLRETAMVLAFCSAAPMHGSRGAIYILLKRNQLGD